MPIVERRIAGDEIIDVAVRVDASGPSEHKGLEIALCGKLQRGGELGRLDANVEAALFGHGLYDLGGLQDDGVIRHGHRRRPDWVRPRQRARPSPWRRPAPGSAAPCRNTSLSGAPIDFPA